MLILLFVICLAGLIANVIWLKKSYKPKTSYLSNCEYSYSACTGIGISGFCLVIVLIALFIVIGFTVHSSYIPAQVEVLRRENTQMEADINTAIQKYCEHENKTYVELKPNEIQFTFTIYPELKADELVNNYIEVLISNRNEIKQLELEYAKSGIYRWWLYFGK